MSMRWLALLCLAGCAAPSKQAAPSWWHGAWVVDGDRLAKDALRLPPEARELAADLARAAAPEFSYEFSSDAVRQVHPDGERTDAYRVLQADERRARLQAGDAVWTVERRPGGLTLHGARELPLRRR